jgi:septal ring factor EnvC (AmiA/AmiB activator)
METEDTMCELRQTVQQLESALSTKQATVQQLQEALNARETEISRLRGKLDEQDSLLLRRKEMIAQTKKERDELRQQNAELINKLAVVGRRQSTSTPPKLK